MVPICARPIRLGDYGFVGRGPIFMHQFPQAWLRLAGLRDGPPFGIDYFQNSIVAIAPTAPIA